MNIDHVCFYVKDAIALRNWFIQKLGFRLAGSSVRGSCTTEVVRSGAIYFVLCAATAPGHPVTSFLQHHPPGVADVAFQVDDIEATIAHALEQGATLIQPLQTQVQAHGTLKWATIAAWGDLTHTLLERRGITSLRPQLATAPADVLVEPASITRFAAARSAVVNPPGNALCSHSEPFIDIDHVVLNVAAGELEHAVTWYEKVLGFRPQQGFTIQTNYSALCSRVMRHPLSGVQLPINEPASSNSQIQEFLEVNGGPGIQHIALETTNLVETIAQLRQQQLPLIYVPPTYYTQLRQRTGQPLPESLLQQLEQQQILADWQQAQPAVLLQTFTQPIFAEPTFFFELIQRQMAGSSAPTERAQGFGEGNFRALFEAIEREQMKRGSLQPLPTVEASAENY